MTADETEAQRRARRLAASPQPAWAEGGGQGRPLPRWRQFLLRPRVKLAWAGLMLALGVWDLTLGRWWQGALFVVWAGVSVWEVQRRRRETGGAPGGIWRGP